MIPLDPSNSSISILHGVEFVISNRNLLGPHHLKDIKYYESVSPWCFDLTNSWIDGKSDDYMDEYALLKLDCK